MMRLSFNHRYSKFGVLKYKDEKSRFTIKVGRGNIRLLLEALPESKSEENNVH